MAMAVRTPCTYPHCRRLALLDHGRCANHQRPNASARGYTAGWSAYARAWLARFPWCGMRQDGMFHMEHSWCARRGVRGRARVVDHIQSIASGGDVFDPSNHQSLCYSCNSKKG